MALAKEIGSNKEYQSYLISIRKIEANEKIGVAQAENINGADIKIIAGGGNVADSVNNAVEVFSPKGGFSVAGALEALAATDAGKELLAKVGLGKQE